MNGGKVIPGRIIGRRSVLLLMTLIGSSLFLMGPIYLINDGRIPPSEAVAVVKVLPDEFKLTQEDPIDHMETSGEGFVTTDSQKRMDFSYVPPMWIDGEGGVTAEVLGALKGDLQPGTTVSIMLRVLPFTPGKVLLASAAPDHGRHPAPGIYLMFLERGGVYGGYAKVKDDQVVGTTPRSGEKVDWTAINMGGNVLVLRHPKPPYTLQPGETLEQAVRRLLGTAESDTSKS